MSAFSVGETGGAELQGRYLAEEWARRGHRVTLVPVEMVRPGGGTETCGGLHVAWLSRPWHTAAGRSEFAEIVRAAGPDLGYVRALSPLATVAPALRRAGVPWVFNFYSRPHCESQWGRGLAPHPRALWLYVRKSVPDELNKRFIRGAAAVVAQTEEQRAALRASYGFEATVILNGHPIPAGPFLKAEPPLVLWVGKDWKRPEAFVELAERLQDTPARFLLVGGLPAALEAAIDAGRWPNVARAGTVTPAEVNRLMAAATVMVSTSPTEGFPNTFIQAWMREAAVVSLTVDPDGVLARDGLGVHSGSVERMAADVRALLADAPRRRGLVCRAREEAGRRHSLPEAAEAFESLFRSVLAREPAGHAGARRAR